MNLQKFFNYFICLIKYLFFHYQVLRLDVPKTSELMKMPSKSISCIFQRFISSTNKASSFYHEMSSIKSWSCKIFIDWMDNKILKWVYRC